MKRIVGMGASVLVLMAMAGGIPAAASATENGAYGWGLRLLGEIGDGTETGPKCVGAYLCAPTPVAVSGLGKGAGNSVVAVAGGGFDSMALLSNGTVVTWGDNSSGQLGNGTSEKSVVPVEVGGLSEVTAVSAGFDYDMALLASGKVMAWGANADGQLGTGSTTASNVPVEVKGLEGVTAIAAGNRHSLALLSDGTVMAWGDNGSGQLGNKSTVDSDEPVQVIGKGAKPLSGVISISAGGYEDDEHSLALLSDRSVAAWGNNEYGQLGTGTKAAHHTAVKVEGLIWPIKAISAGGRHSLALTTIGTVMAWGWNANSELGDGTTGEQSTEPVEVKELTGITAISAGESFSIALRSGGTVTSWGWNVYDELGAGLSAEESNVPVEVSGLEGIVGIGAGTEHALAYGP